MKSKNVSHAKSDVPVSGIIYVAIDVLAVNYFFKSNATESTKFTPSEQETFTELGITVDDH